jgi:hypothetical protein
MNKLFCCLFVCLILPLSADIVSDAIEMKPSSIIKCSPSGNSNGALSPSRAFHILKRNQELQLLSGNYMGVVVVGKNKIIVSGDGKGKCNAVLRITSKDCVVRNLWIKRLIVQSNLVVLNSVIDFVQSENRHKGNQTVVFYNCCIRQVVNHNNDVKLVFINCTFRNGGAVFDINSKTRLLFNDCVLDSGQFVFSIINSRTKKSKIYFKNSYMHGLSGIAVDSLMRKKSSVPAAYSIKEFKKMVNFNFTGIKPLKKAFFKVELAELNKNSFDPEFFLQIKDSPCISAGIIPSKIPYLNKVEKEEPSQENLTQSWEEKFNVVKNRLSEMLDE